MPCTVGSSTSSATAASTSACVAVAGRSTCRGLQARLGGLGVLAADVPLARPVVTDEHRGQADRRRSGGLDPLADRHDQLVAQPIARPSRSPSRVATRSRLRFVPALAPNKHVVPALAPNEHGSFRPWPQTNTGPKRTRRILRSGRPGCAQLITGGRPEPPVHVGHEHLEPGDQAEFQDAGDGVATAGETARTNQAGNIDHVVVDEPGVHEEHGERLPASSGLS